MTLSYRGGNVLVIREEAPGMDYKWFIVETPPVPPVKFTELQEAIKFCENLKMDYIIDYYHP
jgi:hypothetical protein